MVSSSTDCACCACASFIAETPLPPPAFRTRPELSATVTWSAVSLGTEEDTRCTIASTWAGLSGEVGLVCTSTDAVGTEAFSVKTSCCGHGQVHDGGLHAVDRLDGLAQLALEGALVGHLLLEVGAGHALLVQQGVAVPTAVAGGKPFPERVIRCW